MAFGARELTLAGLILGVPAASYFLVFKPQSQQIQKAKAEVEIKNQALEQLRAETARTPDLEAANERIADAIEQIESRLPTNKEVDQVIRQVSDLAVASGLSQPALKSEKPIRSANYMEQPLTLETRGDFAGFYSFMTAVEQLPRITRIPAFKIERDMSGEVGEIEIEFTLSIYFQQEGA